MKYISVPASAALRLVMSGTAEGSFTLDMEEVSGDTVTASTTFAGIPSSASTIATINIPDGTIASSSPLSVDENGDGTADLTLPVSIGGVSLPDNTPPEAVLSFSTTTNDILLSSEDDLSDVAVSPSPSISTSTLSYTLTDEAGNSTTLVFKKIKEKENERKGKSKGKIKAKLLSISSANLSTTTQSIFPENEIEYEWERNKSGNLEELEQKITVRKDFTVRAEYDTKKNKTNIFTKNRETKEKLKETKQGLVILRFTTKQGKLEVEY